MGAVTVITAKSQITELNATGVSDDTNLSVEQISTITLLNVGDKGDPGLSAYQVWLSQGHVGTEQDFLDYLSQKAAGGSITVDFSTPSDEWTVTHNLGYYPRVTVVDSAGTVVDGDIQYVSNNVVQLTFSSPFAGKVYLS